MRAPLGAALVLGLVTLAPMPSHAQRLSTTPPWSQGPRPLVPQEAGAGGSLTPTLLSLVVPGAGQHVLGQGRKWAYFAVEVAGWAAYLNRRSGGIHLRTRYRDYAWANGRIQSGNRVDGPFAYYEAMSKWERSGAFDQDPGTAGVQPELDPVTFNGAIWQRASEIFFPGGVPVPKTDPEYQSALAYYGEHAYGTSFLWDWSSAQAAQQEFADLIHQSDRHFSQATTALGVVIANHLISAADAYLSSRGRGGGARLRLEPSASPWGPGWSAVLRIPWSG